MMNIMNYISLSILHVLCAHGMYLEILPLTTPPFPKTTLKTTEIPQFFYSQRAVNILEQSRQTVKVNTVEEQATSQNLGMQWSFAGPVQGKHCVQWLEPADPNTWNDNFLCFNKDYGVRWSSAGPIPDLDCTKINEPADPHTWNDNFLCVPKNTPWRFLWSPAGPIPGKSCVQTPEPADPHTWNDNHICVEAKSGGNQQRIVLIEEKGRQPEPVKVQPVKVQPAIVQTEKLQLDKFQLETMSTEVTAQTLGLQWSFAGPVQGKHCVQWLELADPNTWNDNFLCFNRDYGVRWSSAGPIPDLDCTKIKEPADPHTWDDNFLCLPKNTQWRFLWSHAGPIPGKSCVQTKEPADPHTWDDNFICVEGMSGGNQQRIVLIEEQSRQPEPVKVQPAIVQPEKVQPVIVQPEIVQSVAAQPNVVQPEPVQVETSTKVSAPSSGAIPQCIMPVVEQPKQPVQVISVAPVVSQTSFENLSLEWSAFGSVSGKQCLKWLESGKTWNGTQVCFNYEREIISATRGRSEDSNCSQLQEAIIEIKGRYSKTCSC